MSWDYRRELDDDDPDQQEPRRRRPAPGKVTLTSSLQPGSRSVHRGETAGASEYLAAPVQRKTNPAQVEDAFGWDSWNETSSQRLQAIASHGVSSPAAPLPFADQIQRSFGRHDISSVEAHVGGAAAESSAALGASAFATGNHVAFASHPDLHTAAHEVAHVVQQRSGVQLEGGIGEAGDAYEQHADAVAEKVVAGESAEALLDRFAGGASSGGAQTDIQRAEKKTAPEAAFLSQLRAESIIQAPRPLRLEPGKAGTVHIVPKSELPLPANAPQIPLYCKLLDRTGQAVAEDSGRWHPTFVVGTTFSLTVPATGARQIELHVNAGRPGGRVLRRALEIESEETDREKAGVERQAIQTKLFGLEQVYRLYRTSRETRSKVGLAGPEWKFDYQMAANAQEAEVDNQLHRHGFASRAEFQAFIDKFEHAFEQEAVHITRELLQKYALVIAREAARYQDPAQVAEVYRHLEYARYEYGEFEQNRAIARRLQAENSRRAPGEFPKQSSVSLDQAIEKGREATRNAEEDLRSWAHEFPLLDEESLPTDRRIDKAALVKADPQKLGVLLSAHAARRAHDIAEVLAQISSEPHLVYKLDKLMPQFYARQGIAPGSIYDLIVQDRKRADANKKFAVEVLVGLVAAAVIVATGGSATPVVVAAGSAAAAGLSVYAAYTEYKEYEQQSDLADVGFADDPSTAWLMIAILGAGLDVGAAFTSMKALAPAARALHATGDVDAFAKAVKALEESQAIEARIARTAEKAAEAKKVASDAWAAALNEFSKKVGSNGGAIFDKKMLGLLKDVIAAKTKQGVYTFQMFVDELRQARATMKLAEMTPEELASVKQLWTEALEDGEMAASTATFHAESTQELLKRHGGSVRKALVDLNAKGLTQEEMVESLTEMYRSSGRDIGGTARLEDGTVVLISRRVGPDQPVNIIRPDGRAEFGHAEVYIDVSRGASQPIRVRDVKGASGDLLPPEATSEPPRTKPAPATASQKSRDERLAELAIDPDKGGKATKDSLREAEVALTLEEQGRLPGPVRRPKRGDGHSGDFVDGKGRDWDHKRPRTRQVLHKEIAEDKVRAGKPSPRFDSDKPMRGEYDLETTLAEIRGEIASGEGILLDLSGLDSASAEQLREAIALHGLESHVIYFP